MKTFFDDTAAFKRAMQKLHEPVTRQRIQSFSKAAARSRHSDQAIPTEWGSLSLRLSGFFIALLILAALSVGYLFDRGRTAALEQRDLDLLRLHAERGADELEHFVAQLRGDVLFLAGVPPIQGIRRAIEAGGLDADGNTPLEQWKARLQRIFLSFAVARPEYSQLRLIGSSDGGRELVRVDRSEDGLSATPPDSLARKGERYYFQEAAALEPGSVYLSRVDLNREHGRISVPHRPTLRAATSVRDPAGILFGVVVVNMDMGWAFERAESFSSATESAYIADERGEILLHPAPGRAFAFEFGTPFRLADAFPGQAERIAGIPPDGGAVFELPGPQDRLVAYITSRDLDPEDPRRRLVFILAAPVEQFFRSVGLMRRESLLGMGGLLLLATVLVVAMVHRLTRSLSVLAKASGAIARGDYRVALPEEDGVEVGRLVSAFRHMAAEVERREDALAELNRDLEMRVNARARELAHEQRRFQASIQGHRIELAKVGRLALSAEVASSVAHQLSQPIAAMCNFAGAAVRLHEQGRLGEDELFDILTRIERLANQAGEILDKLRARIRRREQPPTPFDVNQVTASCLDLLKDLLERQGVRVESRYRESLPALIGDPIGLEQLLVQLVLNALEAMERTAREERRLLVTTDYGPESHLVVIEIGDTGPGVSAALSARLFDPWETDKPGALGIGLSIAQTIVEAFGGRIHMARAVIGGALFRVELPVVGET